MFPEHLLSEDGCVLPSAKLEARIQRRELRSEPGLSYLSLLAQKFASPDRTEPPLARCRLIA